MVTELEHREAIGAMVREHGPFVLRVLRYLGVSEADLQDVGQEVFVTVHRRLPSAKVDSVRSWLYAICARFAANYRRKRARSREVLAADPARAGRNLPDQAEQSHVARATLIRLLDGLDEKRRDVFVLHEIEQLSVPEVASVLGIPLGTAYTRLRAARQEIERVAAELSKGGLE